ncbi:MAG: cytochrome c3 family protein [Polyangiaceae bacterium]
MPWYRSSLAPAVLVAALAAGSASAQPQPAAGAPSKVAPATPSTPKAGTAKAGAAAKGVGTGDGKAGGGQAAADDAEVAKRRHDLDANTCLTCHMTLPDKKLRVVAEQYARSVHRDDRIGCVACHKGNPTDPTVQAHDRENGFVVRPGHTEIAQICGSCHEDPIFVRRFNARLAIDQRKLYELSRHGKLAAAGDANAPTCSDCHGVHEILPVVAPDSTVNRSRVVDLCGKCHSDKKFMAPYELPTTQVEKWRKSSHGKAFMEGNPKAPTCTGCHSPHAGKLPGSVAVSALCDRCHQDQRELFLKSPHAKAFRRLGLPECVPCHGDHGVKHESWLVGMAPDSACQRCHSKDEDPKRVATEVARLLRSVDDTLRESELALKDARARGLYVPDAALTVERLRTSRIRLISNVHTLNLEALTDEVAAIAPLSDEAHRLVAAANKERETERRGYYVALVLAGVLFALLSAKAFQLSRRRSRSAT